MIHWSYLHEETRAHGADAFALRTLTDEDVAERGLRAVGGTHVISASCAALSDDGFRSRRATLRLGRIDSPLLERLLDSLAASDRWEERRLERPSAAAAGLLSAMARTVGAAASDPMALRRAPPATYMYDGVAYDVSVRGAQPVAALNLDGVAFARLTRVDFSVLNRTTREVSRFAATYERTPSPFPLPVQMLFQPNFWLRIELRIDPAGAVPREPPPDAATLARVRAICAS
jgi:hypothetical protein